MGAGRRTRSYTASEMSQPLWAGTSTSSARNLRKSDLGGVIFGCKHSTIKECHSKELFGLPAHHISYVKNIDPGMPLFLFNYSDRKLHGIFEAASEGQLCIDPNAWTSDGSETTPYAAQVRVRIRLPCQPLLEDRFGQIIAANYYEQRLFQFELDRTQTNKLISLFSAARIKNTVSVPLSVKTGVSGSPHVNNASGSQHVGKWSSLFKTSSSLDSTENSVDAEGVKKGSNSGWENPVVVVGSSKQETQTINEIGQSSHMMISNFGSSYLSIVKGEASLEAKDHHPQKLSLPEDRSSLAASISGLGLHKGKTNSHVSREELSGRVDLDMDKIDLDSLSLQPQLDGLNRNLEDPIDKDNLEYCGEVPNSNNMELTLSHVLPGWEYENRPSDCMDQNLQILKCGSSNVSAVRGDALDDNEDAKEESLTDFRQPEAVVMAEKKYSSIHSLVAQLLMEVKELKLSQHKQAERMTYLEMELFESGKEIRRLKAHCPSSDAEDSQSANEFSPDLEDSLLVVGGSDGSSWLSTLDTYSFRKDKLTFLCSMSSVCSYASATLLCGEVFLIGGMDGSLTCFTVKSYNLKNNVWLSRPSLNQRRANLAAVSLTDKIFAIGGANGVQTFSEVEVLDLDIGRWIPIHSMLQKRFAPAAVGLDRVVYVVGGYDGSDYLNSVERYDPREASWTRLKSMATKRGCHSVVVLHEKLYAIGGHNGDTMVPTIEVFDPRAGHWRVEESMNQARGYFGAAVIGDAIYVIGGVKDEENVLNTVECYKEGCGWQLTDRKGVGKRAFFSVAVV